MKGTADKSKREPQSRTLAKQPPREMGSENATFQFVDNRPEARQIERLQEIANNSPQAKKAAQLQTMIYNSPRIVAQRQLIERIFGNPAQREEPPGSTPTQRQTDVNDDELSQSGITASEAPTQFAAGQSPKNNQTGLPDKVKSGVENLSGISLDNVNVHYNSAKPAQLNALAYTQGTDIHVGPGQEQHLAHEAWHVVQQNQGWVKPTMHMADTKINDDTSLEREADAMGAKSTKSGQELTSQNAPNLVQQTKSAGGDESQIGQLEAVPPTAFSTSALQRVVIPQVDVPGLTAALDTTNLDAAKDLIDLLGDDTALANLYAKIKKADQTEDTANNKALIKFLYDKIKKGTATVPENKLSGGGGKVALTWKYWSATATDNVVQAGLRMWVTGDPLRGINWNMIGKHLRGNLTNVDYEQIGVMGYLLDDQNNDTNLVDTYTPAENRQKARGLLDSARTDIRGALDALPDHDGPSYRQSGVDSGAVYGGSVNVGDYIRDTTFWSTSALRISGSAGNWGTDGTAQVPKVYFIINGSTGKYIAKYSGQEEGQKEVLFKDMVTFQVTKIANFRSETFFVYVTEVDAGALPLGQAIKNPYNGNTY